MKAILRLKAKKLELIQLILNTEKPSMLAKAEVVFRKEKGADWWDEINEGERKAIEESIAEADSGQLIPHAKVMKEIRAKYKLEKFHPLNETIR